MEPDLSKLGDEFCPVQVHEENNTLLKKFDIPLSHLDFEYVDKCTDGKRLEKILQILQSGEEGHYPQLIKKTEDRLAIVNPASRYLRKVSPILNYNSLDKTVRKDLTTDLCSWLENIQLENEELETHKKVNITIHEVPEIRKHINIANQTNITNKSPRIKSTDYESWDKYDPDTEVLKMDLETEKLKQAAEESEKQRRQESDVKKRKVQLPEFLTQAEARSASNREREKGNEFYKFGEYEDAIKYYTNSIHYCPCAINHNNRAQAYIKMKKWNEAIADCKTVLEFEENNIKALLRLAQSLEQLKQYQEAFCYLEQAITLDPNNTAAQNLLNQLNSHLNKSTGQRVRMKITEIEEKPDPPKISEQPSKTHSSSIPVRGGKIDKHAKKSILKKTSMDRSQVMLPIPGPSTMPEPYYVVVENKDPEIIKRQQFILDNKPQIMYVRSIDSDDDEECLVVHNTKKEDELENTEQLAEETHEDEYEHEAMGIPSLEMVPSISSSMEDPKDVLDEIVSHIQYDINANEENAETSIYVVDDHFKQPTNNNEYPDKAIDEEVNHNGDIQPGGGGEPHMNVNANNTEDIIENVHMPFNFLRLWSSVHNDGTFGQRAEILRLLHAARLSEVIGCKLDGNMLSDFLQTLYLHFTVPHEVERVYAYIINICQIPRFGIIAMFQTDNDRQRTQSIFEFLEQHGMPLPNEIKNLYM